MLTKVKSDSHVGGEHEHEGKMYIPTGGLPVGFYRLNISDDSTGKEESLQFAVDKGYLSTVTKIYN